MTVVRISTARTTKNGGVAGVRARIERGAVNQAMVGISQALLTDIMLCFEQQRDPWGKPWPRPSEATLTNRIKRTKSGKKLFRAKRRGSSAGRGLALLGAAASSKALMDRGTYRASLHAFVEGNRAGVATNDIRRNVLQFGNPDNRFPNGTWRTRAGNNAGPGPAAPIPARPHFPIRPGGGVDVPQAWIDEYLEMIRLAVMEDAGGGGLGQGMANKLTGVTLQATGTGPRR